MLRKKLDLRLSVDETVRRQEDAERMAVGSETVLQHVVPPGVTTPALPCSILAGPWNGTGCATTMNAVLDVQE